MKLIKSVIIALIFAFSSSVYGYLNPASDNPKFSEVSKEIAKMLENPSFPIEESLKAKVKFVVNAQNEIVVLSVATRNSEELIADFIKSRLNYKKLRSNLQSKVYTLPVQIIAR
jgi:hypothetical protein